ncbi:MAG: hypothetical protein HY360_19090 [Verrucomicrobia bacterium]|nr:hypothetical protein [Verrucomicrobiota bacterium]
MPLLLGASEARHYLWLEVDEFRDIQWNSQVYAGSGTTADKQTNWCSRMAIFPDTTQGGPTKILSLDAHPQRANNSCWREVFVPAAGKYKLWARYSDWRNKTEFFKVKIEQNGKIKTDHEFGAQPVLSESDEMKLRVDFAYAWDSAECPLERGPARVTLYTDRVAEADRDVDVLILTDDMDYVPRERGVVTPAYGAYLDRWMKERQPLKPLLEPAKSWPVPEAWKVKKIFGRDFWFTGWQMEGAAEANKPGSDWPASYFTNKTSSLKPPIMSDPDTAIWTRLGFEDFSPTNHFAAWLKDSKRAFWIECTWPGFWHPKPGVDYWKMYQEIKTTYGEQFLGFYLLEGPFLVMASLPPSATRDDAFDAAKDFILKNQRKGRWEVISAPLPTKAVLPTT